MKYTVIWKGSNATQYKKFLTRRILGKGSKTIISHRRWTAADTNTRIEQELDKENEYIHELNLTAKTMRKEIR